jgi:outer membrane protein TolC
MGLARKVEESRETLTIALETVANAQKALDISQLRYNQQLITTTDLMSDRRALTEAKLSLTQARIQARLAVEEYRVAPVGGM